MRFLTKTLLVFCALFFAIGCATKQMPLPEFNPMTFNGSYTSKVDNFMVLFDASSSMGMNDNGYNKFEVARAVVERMNATLPELSQNAGLRSCGHAKEVSSKDTVLQYGMEKYTTAGLQAGLDKVTKAGGPSPMFRAIDAAISDFKGFSSGRSAVIFISDGLDLPGDVLASAQKLKDTYGDSMCFYPVLVGTDPKGQSLMDGIAKIGKCGFLSNAGDLLSSEGMAEFVQDVFLNVPQGAKPVPTAPKVRLDSDNDGVFDDEDQCPGTPAGATVNSAGCWILENVLFDYDKDVIKPEAYPLLNAAAKVLKTNYKMNVELHGHCDNRGSEAYNKGLSLRRANAVKTYLNSKGIVLSRMTTKGFGFSKPVGSNDSDFGRSLNRRVEIHPVK